MIPIIRISLPLLQKLGIIALSLMLCVCQAHALQFRDKDSVVEYQTNVIDKSYASAYVYGMDNTMDRLAGISLKACLSWINSENIHMQSDSV